MTAASTGDRNIPIVIVGGGAAGISTAARLVQKGFKGKVAVVDPSETHDYQPLWTLVGGGVVDREVARKREADLIPNGVEWIRDAVATFEPEQNAVVLKSGERLTYEGLVVCPGIQIDWGGIEGLEDALKRPAGEGGVVSNYDFDTVTRTWPAIQAFQGGRALFTHPATPIKCGGAPQKIMYLAADAWKKRGMLGKTDLNFHIATPKLFSNDHYIPALQKVCDGYGAKIHLKSNLTAIRPNQKEAVFTDVGSGEQTTVGYDFMHVTPPMSAPDFIKQSPLADDKGWVDVDKGTLQHTRYPNVFALGDASNLPTSKTGAAVRKQAPTVAENLPKVLSGQQPTKQYDGYTSCPLVTGYGSLILAEFGYSGDRMETFPFDQRKERWSMYQLKRHLLPQLYFKGMLKGRA